MPTSTLPFACLLLVSLASAQAAPAAPNAGGPAPNPYRFEPFHPDFPIELEYAPRANREFVHTRRQVLETLAANLQGNVRREAWQLATEFFWRAPEDAVEPLAEAMDRAFGKDAFDDVVKNCVEAMGRMANEAFDRSLRRALQHPKDVVRQAAFAAIGTSGKLDTLREIGSAFKLMDGRARASWLRALRLRLPAEEAVRLLTGVMMAQYPAHIRDEVLKEALQMKAADAAAILRGRWNDAVGEFKAVIAGVLHAAGDGTGTVWLRDALGSEDLSMLTLAVRYCAIGPLAELREPLLRASTHLRPEVRLEVAKTLMRVDGDDVADVYESLAAPDEPWEVRAIALRQLTHRGRPKAVAVLLEELPTADATRLDAILAQLAASGDERAVPVLLERFHRAPEGSSRPFVQALAQNPSVAAAKGLFEIYQGPDKVVGRGSRETLTTRNYLPTLFLNLRGNERVILAGFLALPKSEWKLRAALLPTIAGYAADRDDPALQRDCVAPLREILFDRAELPQMRVAALNLLTRRWLDVDDVLKLKSTHRDEAPGLRACFSDFLCDAF